MIKSTVEQMANPIGFEIGMSDDVIQSELIKGLSRALCNSMNDHQLDTQLCCIVDKLDDKSIKVINGLASFISLRQK